MNPTYTIHLSIPFLPKPVNSWMGEHWRARHTESKKWRIRVAQEIIRIGRPPTCPWKKAKVTLTRCSSGQMDYDGLVSSFKCVLDGLVKCGVLVDDKMTNIGIPTYLHEKAVPGKGGIKIVVEEME